MTAQIIDLACANCGEPISAGQLVAVLWDARRIHMPCPPKHVREAS